MLMENLIICSRTLYDADISDKMKEIDALKRRVSELERELGVNIAPKVFCKNHGEWHGKITYILEYIYDNISNIRLVEPGGDHELLTGPGLWMISDKQDKSERLTQLFIWLTGNEKWAHKVTCDIMSDIKCILDMLKPHEKYSAIEIRDFIYYFIQEKLCDRHKYSILADIPQYRCKKCGVIYNDPYDSEDGGETFEVNENCVNCV
jgi:hypothetical protein